MLHATRKIVRYQSGSASLTLTEYLGKDWEYVEIFGEPNKDGEVTVRIVVLSKREISDSPSTEIRETSQSA